MFSYKEITELAGYTSRVSTLLDVIDDIQAGHFEKKLVSSADIEENASVLRGRGIVTEGADIEFIDVPIVSPNGDVLVRALSFSVKPGDHLLIVGPNGCGKSSLFRILGGLWPVYGGKVRKPPFEDIFYIPQRPYLSRGTLRQQIIYPDSLHDMHSKSITDNDILSILETLNLESLIDRPGGFDAEAQWEDVLSGGLQQRVAMARLFYHKPRYAILDECTSSVTLESATVEVSGSITPGYCSLMVKAASFGGLNAERRAILEDEKEDIDLQLRAVPDIEQRIKELEASR
ncbi:unnamed protein product [Alternaria alternata]